MYTYVCVYIYIYIYVLERVSVMYVVIGIGSVEPSHWVHVFFNLRLVPAKS